MLSTLRFTTLKGGLATLMIAFMSVAGFLSFIPSAQAANNAVLSIVLKDTNTNGKINSIEVSIDNDAAETWTVAGTPTSAFAVTQSGAGITISGVTISGSATADPVVVVLALSEADTDLVVSTDGVTLAPVEVAYTQVDGTNTCNNCVRDTSGELATFATGDGSGPVTEQDQSSPLLISSSPAHNATGVSATGNIVLTFSEPIDAATFAKTVSPTLTLTTTPTTGSTSTITLSSGVKNIGTYTFTVTGGTDLASRTFGGAASGLATNPFNFTVNSTNNSNSSEPVVASYAMAVTAPNGGESLVAGQSTNITWTATQTNGSAMAVVNISYSADGGETWTTVVTNEANDGSYLWTLPDITSSNVWIKVSGTDLAVTLASDTSNAAFSVTGGATVFTDDEESTDETEDTEDTEDETMDDSDESNDTNLDDEVVLSENVTVGDYVKTSSSSSVYLLDLDANGNLVRRVFMNEKIFFTWQDDFDAVVTVSDDFMAEVGMGSLVLPREGVVLLKFESVAAVYALESTNTLRWITTEAAAVDIYGSAWADYVLELPPTMYHYFMLGDSISAGEAVDMDDMKKRVDLHG